MLENGIRNHNPSPKVAKIEVHTARNDTSARVPWLCTAEFRDSATVAYLYKKLCLKARVY